MALLRKVWNFYLDIVWYSMPGVALMETAALYADAKRARAEAAQREYEKLAALNG